MTYHEHVFLMFQYILVETFVTPKLLPVTNLTDQLLFFLQIGDIRTEWHGG
jgi:hypothetical protein